MPGAIAPLLADRPAPVAARTVPRTAIFYSISNCQRGLAGISFGNFLIKQVVEELQPRTAELEDFVTLVAGAGLPQWLKRTERSAACRRGARPSRAPRRAWLARRCGARGGPARPVEPCAAQYFLKAKRADGRPVDPVARFHLGNGARLERINWLADTSPKGLRDSAGMMVNYLYDLDEIEENHEAYANQGEIAAANSVKRLLKTEAKSRFGLPATSLTSLSFG